MCGVGGNVRCSAGALSVAATVCECSTGCVLNMDDGMRWQCRGRGMSMLLLLLLCCVVAEQAMLSADIEGIRLFKVYPCW